MISAMFTAIMLLVALFIAFIITCYILGMVSENMGLLQNVANIVVAPFTLCMVVLGAPIVIAELILKRGKL